MFKTAVLGHTRLKCLFCKDFWKHRCRCESPLPLSTLTHFEKEQALCSAGVYITPYPTKGPATERSTQTDSDWALLDAGSAWEQEIDRLYAEMIVRQGLSPDPG